MTSTTIVAVSSHVMRGTVGLRAISFPLMRRGHEVWAIPTVTLPWHPGFGPSTRAAVGQLPAQLRDLSQAASMVDAVLTGYFASADQVFATAQFIDKVRAARPDALIVVDPVTGDENGRYVPDAVAEAIATELLPRAHIATPNVNELSDFAGDASVASARALGADAVVVTSAIKDDARVGSWLVEAERARGVAHKRAENPPRGTGDLFSALMVSAVLKRGGRTADLMEALTEASAATLATISASGPDHLALAAAQDELARPNSALVSAVSLGGPASARPAPAPHAAPAPPGKGRVYGVDGCPGGWAVVSITASGPPEPTAEFMPDLKWLIDSGAVFAVDIPIGLPDRIEGPGRPAEQAVRTVLKGRQSSVFSVPGRAAVYAPDYPSACAAALETSDPPRKVSKQAFMIFDKIREVDGMIGPDTQGKIFESHAELAFWRLNGDVPMPTAKKVKNVPMREGLAERITLLAQLGIPERFFDEERPKGIPLVDLVDAAAIALIARRCAAGTAEPFPNPPATDARGLRVAMWA